MCQETMTVSTSCGFSFDMPLFQVTNREKNEARKCDYEPSLWGCRDGAVARALASHQCVPGFDSQIRRQMWFEVVGSLLCTERFSSGTPVSPLLKNQNLI